MNSKTVVVCRTEKFESQEPSNNNKKSIIIAVCIHRFYNFFCSLRQPRATINRLNQRYWESIGVGLRKFEPGVLLGC